MSERRLVLVRHGVTDWNREGRFQGHLDPPLAADGLAEAELVAARLAADPADRPRRVVTSTLDRARSTAAAIAAACDAPLVDDPRLIEVGQGEWEGRTHAELAVEDAARYQAWRTHDGTSQPPGAEPLATVVDRIRAAVAALDDGGPWPLAAVSHGGTLRLVAQELLGLDAARAWSLDFDNAAVSVLVGAGDGAWRLVTWNDARHLLGRVATHVDESEGEPLAL